MVRSGLAAIVLTAVLAASSSATGAPPRLVFSDLVDGCRSCLTDEVVSGQGVIVTVWGHHLGSSQADSRVFVRDPDGDVHEAAHVYTWCNADGGASGGGPSNLYRFHKLQEVAFALPASVDTSAVEEPSGIFVQVGGMDSNQLDFVVRESGNAYFVSTGGDDANPGTWEQPRRHFFNPEAGDVVYYLTGDDFHNHEDQHWRVKDSTGEIGNRIAHAAYPGQVPEIVSASGGIANYNRTGSHQVFSKIKIRADNGNSHFPHGRYVGIYHTDRTCASPFGVFCGAMLFRGAKYYGNHIDQVGGACSDSNKKHTTYFTIRKGYAFPGFDFGWNLLEDNENRGGIHYYDEHDCGTLTTEVLVHDNVVVNQTGNCIAFMCLNADNCSGTIKIFNNLCIETGGNNSLGMYGSKALNIEGWDANTKIYVHNNTFYGWSYDGCHDTGGMDGCAMFGLDNYRGEISFQNNIAVDTHNMRNFYDERYEQSFAGTGHNIWYNGGDGSPANLPAWDSSPLSVDPLFADPAASDFRLTPASPAVDAGSPDAAQWIGMDLAGVHRPLDGDQGGTSEYDIGAYEYDPDTPPECDDGRDNDGDGDVDFPDDAGCSSAYDFDESDCGDGICETDAGEQCHACPADCGSCCGDGACEPGHGETCQSCPPDCPVGDGQVCCGGELHAGDCCVHEDCGSGQACVDHVCDAAPACTPDADGDFYGDGADCLGADCDDGNPDVHPGAPERCNQIDDDCDETIDEGCQCLDGASEPCYQGPAGTQGVGVCTGGTRVCDQGTWGDCADQVVPSQEVCDDGLDNDCNGQVDGQDTACDETTPDPRMNGSCSCGGHGRIPPSVLLVLLALVWAGRSRP